MSGNTHIQVVLDWLSASYKGKNDPHVGQNGPQYRKGNSLMAKPDSEFVKFDSAVKTILAVSHDELKRRETKWKKQRKLKKQQRADSHK